MPAPYTIKETAQMSGLTVKFIRRLKEQLPSLFQEHTDRGNANALLFSETIVEILKQVALERNKGRTLRQIVRDLSPTPHQRESTAGMSLGAPVGEGGSPTSRESLASHLASLARENAFLKEQLTFFQKLLETSERRFERLLPAHAGDLSTHNLRSPLTTGMIMLGCGIASGLGVFLLARVLLFSLP